MVFFNSIYQNSGRFFASKFSGNKKHSSFHFICQHIAKKYQWLASLLDSVLLCRRKKGSESLDQSLANRLDKIHNLPKIQYQSFYYLLGNEKPFVFQQVLMLQRYELPNIFKRQHCPIYKKWETHDHRICTKEKNTYAIFL